MTQDWRLHPSENPDWVGTVSTRNVIGPLLAQEGDIMNEAIKILMLFVGSALIFFSPSMGLAQKYTPESRKPVISVLPTGECGEWWKLKKLLPYGFEGMVEVKDEIEAKDEKFWGVLRISCSQSEVKTEWTFRAVEKHQRAIIKLQPNDRTFSTNWEDIDVRGYKRPGLSRNISDWDSKDIWAEVPKLEIQINTQDAKTLITILRDYNGAIRFAAFGETAENNGTKIRRRLQEIGRVVGEK
jgi:hypothetical protein